jgi:hypothetical protein
MLAIANALVSGKSCHASIAFRHGGVLRQFEPAQAARKVFAIQSPVSGRNL